MVFAVSRASWLCNDPTDAILQERHPEVDQQPAVQACRLQIRNQPCPVNLVEPHSVLGARVNEFNMRVGKIFRFGGNRANVGVDFYNLLNAATPLSYNQAFIPTGAWLTPTSVLSARFAKLSLQLDF